MPRVSYALLIPGVVGCMGSGPSASNAPVTTLREPTGIAAPVPRAVQPDTGSPQLGKPAADPTVEVSSPESVEAPRPQVTEGQGCLQYASEGVVLEGVIERATFAGSPNYQSVARGDQQETCWLLRVARPFCVDASFDLSGNLQDEAHSRVRKVQLVFLDHTRSYDAYRSLVGRTVHAKGELLGASTGHHHTEVLLSVTDLTAQH